MNISKMKLAWKYVTGGMGGVTDYLLDILNNAIDGLDNAKKERIQAVLNIAERVLATLTALKWLCPTKWQTAYTETIAAVSSVRLSLCDLALTKDELFELRARFRSAVAAWKGGDDETCQE